MNTSSTQRAILLSALIVVVTFNQHAVSQEKAWKGSADGQTAILIESPGHYDQFSGWGGGQLGNFVAIGTHTMHSDLSLTGQATWVVDGGDLLIVSYDGRVTITEDEVRPYRFNATM